MKNVFIVLDVETGGLSAKENPITQLSLSIVEPKTFKVLDQYTTFVQVYDDLIVTKDALERSRVSMDEINSGITADKLLEDFIKLIKKHIPKGSKSGQNLPILVGHNVPFDKKFLNYLFSRRSKDIDDFVSLIMYDTMRLAIDHEMNKKGADKLNNTLSVVCARYGIKLKSAHGAEHDVYATLQLFKVLMSKFRENQQNEIQITTSDSDQSNKSRKFFELP